MQNIINTKDFKADNIIFSEPSKDKKGSTVVYMRYKYPDGTEDFTRLRTGKMGVPFGVSSMDGQKPSKEGVTLDTQDSIQFTLTAQDINFKTEMEKFDNKAIQFGIDNAASLGLCDEDEDPAVVKSMIKKAYINSLKFSIDPLTKKRNDKYPPSFKGKLYKDQDGSGNYKDCKFYDSKTKESMDINISNIQEVIPKMSEAASILVCTKMWFISGKFGCAWVPKQIKVYKSASQIPDYAFEDDDDSVEQVTTAVLETHIDDTIENIENIGFIENIVKDDDVYDEDPLEQIIERETEQVPVKSTRRKTKKD
jgi:hypothetical protein